MSALEFRFQDVLTEVDALDKIVGSFCQPRSRMVLPELITTLENIRDNAADRSWGWGIRQNNPFYTAISRGSYQPNDQGQDNVFAEITSTWTIKKLPPKKRSAKAERFRMSGNASTRVRLFREAAGGHEAREIA